MTQVDRCVLMPGEYAVTWAPAVLETLLGSCVSVCLRHPARGFAAMNHFMLPTGGAVTGTAIGRYGDAATEHVVQSLLARDANPRRYEAQLFGGASVIGAHGPLADIGQRNIAMAREVLRHHGIPVKAEDVGGTSGRRITFTTATGEVVCRAITPRTGAPVPGAGTAGSAAGFRVLVVGRSAAQRLELRAALAGHPSIKVIGEAGDAFDTREVLLRCGADVVLLALDDAGDAATLARHITRHFRIGVVTVGDAGVDRARLETSAHEIILQAAAAAKEPS